MKRIALLLVCLGCVALGFAAKTTIENEAIAAFLRTYGVWISVVGLGGLVSIGLGLLIAYVYIRHRLHKLLGAEGRMSEAEIAAGLVDMVTTPEGITNPTPEDRQRAALVNAGTWLMRRQATQFYFNVTVTIVGGLVGTATLFLLYEQNVKFDAQNERITLQTDANITQSLLLEGARRAALSTDLSALIEDIRTVTGARAQFPECLFPGPQPPPCWVETNQRDLLGERSYVRLPNELWTRITAFLVENTPYLVAEAKTPDIDFDARLRDQFDFSVLSPERGQVLKALADGQVHVQGLDFSAARLDGADLSANELPAAQLRGASLRGTNLTGANLRSAIFIGAHFEDATLIKAEMDSANMSSATVRGTSFNLANLVRVNLSHADLSGSDLTGVPLRGANLSGTTFFDTQVTGVDFTNSNVVAADISGAWAWADAPPKGLPPSMTIVLCTFDGDPARVNPFSLSRKNRPPDCALPAP